MRPSHQIDTDEVVAQQRFLTPSPRLRREQLTNKAIPRLLLIGVITGIYVAAAKLGLSLAFVNTSVSPVWPPTGIAIAAVLLFGYRVLPAVFLGAFIANLASSVSIVTALGISVGNTLEAVSAAFLLYRLVGLRNPLHRALDVLRVVVIAGIISPSLSATIGNLTLCLTGAASWGDFGLLWLTWWLGDGAGALVLAPFLLSWFEHPFEQVWARRWWEALVLFSALSILSLITFGGFFSIRVASYSLGQLTIPFLLWAAFRFGPRGASSAIVVLSGVAIWGTTRGLGPFVTVDLNRSLLFLQVFVVALSTAALFLAAVVAEYRRSVTESTFLASIVESTDDAVIGKTTDAIVVSWNKGAEEMYGYAAHEIIGRSISTLIPPDCGDDLREIMERLNRGERIKRLERIRMRKDGQRIIASLSISPIHNAAGKIVGAATIARDITGRKKAEAERERLLASERTARKEAEEARKLSADLLVREKEARLEAEVANRAKDEFLAIVSHELRTPLNAILGWVNILLSGDPTDDSLKSRGLDVIKRNAKLQAQIIEDILDVSRFIAGKFRLDVQEVDVRSIVQAALASAHPTAEEKGVRLVHSMDQQIDPVIGDSGRLHQIVWNLLSNAVKFTPSGGQVEVSLAQSGSNVLLTISDTGEGIPAESLPHIFDRFRQGKSSSSGRYSGLGLGLAIARNLVELHGGTIKASSNGPNQGSRFTVTLPCARTRDESADARGSGMDLAGIEGGRTFEGLRLLLVDDDPDSLDMLATALALEGASTKSARSVREALSIIEGWKPDVLVSDIGMPDEDGYALIREIRGGVSTPKLDIPTIALTGFASEHEAARVLAAGYDVHLAKPVEPGYLIETIARLRGPKTFVQGG
jgi:PAS domain S-box-containing protein